MSILTITPSARKLIEHFSLKDVQPYKSNFIDNEAVLLHLRNNTPQQNNIKDFYILNNTSNTITMKKTNSLRSYQQNVVDFVVNSNRIYPSLIVMPCGSGKTFTALNCIFKTKGNALIITNYKIVANQWKNEILNNFNIDPSQIQCIADVNFEFNSTNIKMFTILTYDTITSYMTSQSRKLLFDLLMTDFTCVVLDEAHKAVATSYFNIISRLSGPFIAFTATPVREDSEMKLLKQLIKYEKEVSAKNLVKDGFISEIVCSTVKIPINKKLYNSSLTHNEQIVAAVINPNKLAYLSQLLTKMYAEKQRILVFCDDIWSMDYTYKKMKSQHHSILGPVDMRTSLAEREKIVRKFLEDTNTGKILMISRTGDEGIDVPSATKLIQICTPWGSRRQHAQRIGRIQRPCSNDINICEAITLVSENTLEIGYAERRDQYLKEMEYDVSEYTVDINIDANYKKILSKLRKRNIKPKSHKKSKVKNIQKVKMQKLKFIHKKNF
tara:strand:+ start:2644 stop:4131 length:1488 start_codon:yes stop_codon:yes gene_type:complete